MLKLYFHTSPATTSYHMETVAYGCCFREGASGYCTHTVRQIHCDTLYIIALVIRQLIQYPQYIHRISAFDYSNNGTFSSMTILIVDYRV